MEMNERVSFSGILWHVVYVEPQHERKVIDDIVEDLGFEAYAPMEKRMILKRGRRVEDNRPLFARYIFAGVDPYKQGWQEILDVDGVVDVLGRPPMDIAMLPSCIPGSWVRALQRAEAAGDFDRTMNNASQFNVGEKVTVSEGPFVGMEAVIQEFIAKLKSSTAKKRAKVLMAFMGRMSAVEVDITTLEKM